MTKTEPTEASRADLLSATLNHLRQLVACDTQNPPREISASGVFDYLRAQLRQNEQFGEFRFEFEDHGEGCQSLLALRGEPRILFNFHVDTVPASKSWAGDPFALEVTNDRAIGLGACDIKGASACMLAALAQAPGDVALLFTSDEEAGSSRCVREFMKAYNSPENTRKFDAVIVAEPTQGVAVLEHRGISTASGVFKGVAGHASERRALADSAVHRAVRWADAALKYAEAHEQTTYRSLSGIRFNIGAIEGGIKPNIIAPSASVRFGFRPLPDQDHEVLMAEVQALAVPQNADEPEVEWSAGFFGPTLPADGDVSKSRAFAEKMGLEVGEAVDFWTEASLFSQGGLPAVVYGPGDIAQAHTAGEWVELAQLEQVAQTYKRLLS